MFSKEILKKMSENLCLSAEEKAEVIEDLVNCTGWYGDDIAKKLSKMHRYLQQEFFKMVLTYVARLANNYEKGWYDGRNEWACKMARLMMDGIKANDKSYYDYLMERCNRD